MHLSLFLSCSSCLVSYRSCLARVLFCGISVYPAPKEALAPGTHLHAGDVVTFDANIAIDTTRLKRKSAADNAVAAAATTAAGKKRSKPTTAATPSDGGDPLVAGFHSESAVSVWKPAGTAVSAQTLAAAGLFFCSDWVPVYCLPAQMEGWVLLCPKGLVALTLTLTLRSCSHNLTLTLTLTLRS